MLNLLLVLPSQTPSVYCQLLGVCKFKNWKMSFIYMSLGSVNVMCLDDKVI